METFEGSMGVRSSGDLIVASYVATLCPMDETGEEHCFDIFINCCLSMTITSDRFSRESWKLMDLRGGGIVERLVNRRNFARSKTGNETENYAVALSHGSFIHVLSWRFQSCNFAAQRPLTWSYEPRISALDSKIELVIDLKLAGTTW
jgi:hypothetical protein